MEPDNERFRLHLPQPVRTALEIVTRPAHVQRDGTGAGRVQLENRLFRLDVHGRILRTKHVGIRRNEPLRHGLVGRRHVRTETDRSIGKLGCGIGSKG